MPPLSNPAKIYHAGTLTYTKGALVALFFWLIWGDFCYILMETIVGIVPIRLNTLGASNLLLGSLGSVAAIINMICNPIISVKSDRHRGRWGRRIPFIFFTAPFLSVLLLGVGFSERIAGWLHSFFGPLLSHYSPATVAIVVLSVFITVFSFFNTFVNSVFWYLFNDVVPEVLLARFMSWFRMVGFLSGSAYNLFIFPYANDHFPLIFAGAGLFYLIGFGLMCLNVKEGQYPPPPPLHGGAVGPVAALKTYVKECLGLSHYWYLFVASMGLIVVQATTLFAVFFQEAMGLNLTMIGRLAFVCSITATVVIPLSGWLADKYHPLRVVLAGIALQMIISPIGLIWLFVHPTPAVFYEVSIVLGIFLGSPIGFFLTSPVISLICVIDPPLFMRIFPREKYGQFCSANAMCRSLTAIVTGPLVGEYLDLLTAHFGQRTAYCLLPVWNFLGYGVVLFALVKLYRSWQRHGGDTAYMPPILGSPYLDGIPNLTGAVQLPPN